MNSTYAIISLIFMSLIYVYISKYNSSNGGIIKLFKGVLFQLSRQLQIFVRKRDNANNFKFFSNDTDASYSVHGMFVSFIAGGRR